MEQSKLVERLEGYRRRNNADRCYVNFANVEADRFQLNQLKRR